MQKTYEIIELEGKEMLREEATIKQPIIGDFTTPPLRGIAGEKYYEYIRATNAYNEHISSLRVYPISGYIGQAGTKGLVENVHFYLKDQFTKPTADRKALIREIVAHPIAQDEKAFSKSPTSLTWPSDEQIEKMAEDKWKETLLINPIKDTPDWCFYEQGFSDGAKAIIELCR